MRVPAPGSILKLSRESDIRHSSHPPHVQASNLPPCNFAVVPPDFPQRSPAAPTAPNSGIAVRIRSPKLPNLEPSAPSPHPQLLQNCHIVLARVTLLATIASATHGLRQDLQLFYLDLASKARSSSLHAVGGKRLPVPVTPGRWSADRSAGRCEPQTICTSRWKG